MPWLSITAGPGAGQRHELQSVRSTIGRDAANLVQIADPKSSRVHAEIVVEGGRSILRDLDSSNGTWMDNGRVTSMPLIHGATFRIGATHFRFDSMVSTPEGEGYDPATIEGLDHHKTVLFTQAPGRDLQALSRANTYLVLLHHLILRSNAATDRDALFELLDDAAAEVLEGDRCAVFIPAESGWTLWPAHERRLRARFGAVPFARTLLSAVRARGEPLLCTNDGDLKPSASMVQSGVQSAMAAPVRLGDEVHALLYVDRLAAAQAFSRADLEFLAAVANQMAARLANRATVDALQAEVRRLQQAPPPLIDFIGSDPAVVDVRQQAEQLAAVAVPVLIVGEPGSGKELLARFIHSRSARNERPFQVITCAGLDSSAAEALLFGRATGGAGALELADGGTLFLDELGEVPTSLQPRLLRVIESGEIQRQGDAALRRVDVRIMAATARDLAVVPGSLRSDLLHTFAGQRLEVPSLRHRPGDIEVLTDYLLDQYALRRHQPVCRPTPEVRVALFRYGWPGNVRELRHVLERACTVGGERQLQLSDFPEHIRHPGQRPVEAAITPLAVVEKAHILRVLEHCGGNKKVAAELLEIDRSTLYAKLKQYGVS